MKKLITRYAKGGIYAYSTTTDKVFITQNDLLTYVYSQLKSKYGLAGKTPCKFKSSTTKGTTVTIESDKLLSVCPFRGCPDISKLKLVFIINSSLLEISAFKCFLECLEHVAISHEDLAKFIKYFIELNIEPTELTITVDAGAIFGMTYSIGA